MSRYAAALVPRHERHEQEEHRVGHCPDERHDWRPGAGFGWYECATCGQIGVCVACHDPVMVVSWPASWGARMRCPEHATEKVLQ